MLFIKYDVDGTCLCEPLLTNMMQIAIPPKEKTQNTLNTLSGSAAGSSEQSKKCKGVNPVPLNDDTPPVDQTKKHSLKTDDY